MESVLKQISFKLKLERDHYSDLNINMGEKKKKELNDLSICYGPVCMCAHPHAHLTNDANFLNIYFHCYRKD